MYKVKDFEWKKIIFTDRTILKEDLRKMSWQQVRTLDNLEVRSHEETEDGITLFV